MEITFGEVLVPGGYCKDTKDWVVQQKDLK